MAKAPTVPIQNRSYGATKKLTGNGMHIPCAGALVIIAALHVQKKHRK